MVSRLVALVVALLAGFPCQAALCDDKSFLCPADALRAGDVALDTLYNNTESSPASTVDVDTILLVHGFAGTLKDFGEVKDWVAFGKRIGVSVLGYRWRTQILGAPPSLEAIALDFSGRLQGIASRKLLVLAHSTGGLIARAAILHLIGQGLDPSVEKLLLASVPNAGVLSNILPMTPKNAQLRAIQFGSEFLDRLNTSWEACQRRQVPHPCGPSLPHALSITAALPLPAPGAARQAYFDSTVFTASAWLQDTPLLVHTALHPAVANIGQHKAAERAVRAVADASCKRGNLQGCEGFALRPDIEQKIAPIILVRFPREFDKIKDIASPHMRQLPMIPEKLINGLCCGQKTDSGDQEQHQIAFFLNRYFVVPSGVAHSSARLSVDFSTRTCEVPLSDITQRLATQAYLTINLRRDCSAELK